MKKFLRSLIKWIPLSALLFVGFNNCAQPVTEDYDFASTGRIEAEELDSEKLGIPIALLSAEQTLQSMLNVTNIATAPASVLTEYNARYGALPAGNDLSMANAPSILSATSLAGEVCNSMVASERALAAADRAFFNSVNFNSGISTMSEDAVKASIRGMARSFWGRNETQDEQVLLLGYKLEFTEALAANARNQAASSANFMTALCSAMLSSLDAITY